MKYKSAYFVNKCACDYLHRKKKHENKVMHHFMNIVKNKDI